jgi:hypothetical protein
METGGFPGDKPTLRGRYQEGEGDVKQYPELVPDTG